MVTEKMTLPTDESIHKKFHEIKNKWHDADGTNMDRVIGALNDFSSWIRSQTTHNDAIEFAEWLNNNEWKRVTVSQHYHGKWYDSKRDDSKIEMIYYSSEELYKKFKSKS